MSNIIPFPRWYNGCGRGFFFLKSQKNRLKSARRAKHQINAANKIARGTKGDLEIDIPDLDPLPESVLNSVNTARYKNRHTNQVQKPRKATCPESVVRLGNYFQKNRMTNCYRGFKDEFLPGVLFFFWLKTSFY